MISKAATPDEYFAALPEDRKAPMLRLRRIFLKHLPKGFEEQMTYGMVGYVVPHSLYPPGYHCDPKLPLGFVSIASQKNYISMYHSCLYGRSVVLDWFLAEYPKHSKAKLDMGKCCVRFKKPEALPFDLITELAKKMTPQQWIAQYEAALKRPAEPTFPEV
ncbi:MAG TPA: DUF1801 domain-containing protein [Chthoniobacteraceae bacterium]|jgi:hypothetical protein|nr:DUF1801 domain-containing protein [Chthoniobacteraceae bacterium]